ncbi:MAG: hypothetical protein AB7K09_13415 [Planctomycetota bacterium]
MTLYLLVPGAVLCALRGHAQPWGVADYLRDVAMLVVACAVLASMIWATVTAMWRSTVAVAFDAEGVHVGSADSVHPVLYRNLCVEDVTIAADGVFIAVIVDGVARAFHYPAADLAGFSQARVVERLDALYGERA